MVNWSLDYKKVRVLEWLYAHKEDGNSRPELMNMAFADALGAAGRINKQEFPKIADDLEADSLITINRHSKNVVIYKITEQGEDFVEKLNNFRFSYRDVHFFDFFRAIDQPTTK